MEEYLYKQGLGYALFLFTLPALFWAVKGWLDEKEKRTQDAKDLSAKFAETAEKLLNSNSSLQKTVDAIAVILQTKK